MRSSLASLQTSISQASSNTEQESTKNLSSLPAEQFGASNVAPAKVLNLPTRRGILRRPNHSQEQIATPLMDGVSSLQQGSHHSLEGASNVQTDEFATTGISQPAPRNRTEGQLIQLHGERSTQYHPNRTQFTIQGRGRGLLPHPPHQGKSPEYTK